MGCVGVGVNLRWHFQIVKCKFVPTDSPAAAMTPPPLLLAVTLLPFMSMTSLPVSAAEGETCFFRQHQSVTVNVRQASNRTATATQARVVGSQQDCVHACCSAVLKTGGNGCSTSREQNVTPFITCLRLSFQVAKCNMAVFNANKKEGEENCFLFHCQTDQDCPLRKALNGVSTYNIYKGKTG